MLIADRRFYGRLRRFSAGLAGMAHGKSAGDGWQRILFVTHACQYLGQADPIPNAKTSKTRRFLKSVAIVRPNP